jgi:hypothetical protein
MTPDVAHDVADADADRSGVACMASGATMLR